MLALVRRRGRLIWAVADPWELRSCGTLPASDDSLPHQVRRLLIREKPTAIVPASRSLARCTRRLNLERSVLVPRPLPTAIPAGVARDLYPEFDLFTPTAALVRVASLAITHVLYAPIPSRSYAPRRRRTIRRAA